MKYIIAHDLGTSGNKATLFSEEGRLVGSTVYSYGTHYYNATPPARCWRRPASTGVTSPPCPSVGK